MDVMPVILSTRSYLSDRTQSFLYNGHQTESFPINCSVPQGSVLGPVEFAAYTKDITDLTEVERRNVCSHLYADDTQLHDTACACRTKSTNQLC